MGQDSDWGQARYARQRYPCCAVIDGYIGFDKLYGLVDKLGAPVNKLSNKLGSEAFWPTTLDKESDKAARILRSFCSEFLRLPLLLRKGL